MDLWFDRTIDELDIIWRLWLVSILRSNWATRLRHLIASAFLFDCFLRFWLLVFNYCDFHCFNFFFQLDENSFVQNGGPNIIKTFKFFGILLCHMERDGMVEQEWVWYIILCITLKIENYPKLIINEAGISELPELITGLLPKLWEPNCWHEHPRAWFCTSLNQPNWIFFVLSRELLVRVVELLPQWVLHEVELTNWCLNVWAYVSFLEVTSGHRSQLLISLLLSLHADRSMILQVGFYDGIDSDVDSSFLLKD